MFRRLVGTLALVLAATTLVAVTPASATTRAPATVASEEARPKLLRGKPYFGRCKNTCKVYVRLRNVSRQSVFSVKLRVSLKVNGRKVGTCHDYVGTIRAGRKAVASCTVRSGKLASMWRNRYSYGEWYTYASTYVTYLYYR